MGSRIDETIARQVTVVIPNYNGKDFLKACLESVLAGDLVPAVLVVDNGSDDGSLELLAAHFPQVQVAPLPVNTGFCHAVNTGIRLTRTRFVMLLNNDTVVDAACVRELALALFTDDRAFSAQAKMRSLRDPSVLDGAGDFYCALGWAYARGKAQSAERYNKKQAIFSACAGAAMYRREVFEEIGYFDERHFCYLEDVDIGYRAKLFGYRNLYVPAAVVDHWGSAASGAVHNPFKEEMTAGNNAYLLYKNMPVGQFVLNAPLLWLGREIKRHYFAGKGLGKAYNTGIERGRLLRERAKAMQRAKEAGTPLPKAALAKEAALPEDALGRTPAEKINPLYLGEKQPFALRRLPRYAGIQMELWANTLRRLFS